MAIKNGFTLIELIVVIGLLGLLSVAISSIMLTSLVSSSSVRSATKVKQAGTYVLGQVQNLIRNAKEVVICESGATPPLITIVNPDGGQTTLTSESDGTNTRIASNSGNYLTPPSLAVSNYLLSCNPSDTDPTLVNFSFDLEDTQSPRTTTPAIHFETSVNLRNR
jgi:prepilin-type N-terminal cleavage/methylation domain-containing protein